jgi:ABC-type dipeptide/oligopeptide/nickel transport system permease subunit
VGASDAANLLGTDKLGRDIASRLVVGAKVSLTRTRRNGYHTGRRPCGRSGCRVFWGATDTFIMRAVDIVLAFPEVVLAILFAAVIGPGLVTVITALSLVWWPGIARLTRSLILVQKQEHHVVQEPMPSWGGMIRDGLPALRGDPMLAVSGSIVLGLSRYRRAHPRQDSARGS